MRFKKATTDQSCTLIANRDEHGRLFVTLGLLTGNGIAETFEITGTPRRAC